MCFSHDTKHVHFEVISFYNSMVVFYHFEKTLKINTYMLESYGYKRNLLVSFNIVQANITHAEEEWQNNLKKKTTQ